MMSNELKRKWIALLAAAMLLGGLLSCANVASPNGGPYDETPPKFVSSTPAPGQLNYHGKRVEILFDELIQVDKPQDNVIVTPPQLLQPTIKTMGKKIVVELHDSLQNDATYTIDFTSSIADNNEKNVLENYSFAFSTGDTIDSLEVSGTLLYANNLEPASGIIIGLHRDLADSAFVKETFYRTSRTNDRGHFTVRNIKPGKYRIYALNDQNRNFRFDQKSEEIAWSDSIIVPHFEFATRQDTTWKDSTKIDTIKTVNYTHFLPDKIELRLFAEKYARKYMTRPERLLDRRFTLHFNSPEPTPVIRPIGFSPADSSWFYIQKSDEGKALNYWITDSTVWKRDTLGLSVTYLKTDSAGIDRPQTDTLSIATRRRVEKRRKNEPEPLPKLAITVNAANAFDMNDTLKLTFGEPVTEKFRDTLRLQLKSDSVWKPCDFTMFPDTTDELSYFILRKWNYGEQYRFNIDSAAIRSVYGNPNDSIGAEFNIKSEDSYGHLFVTIQGLSPDAHAYGELLNSNDAVVRHTPLKNGGLLFMDIKPDKYYVRLIKDDNENGKWDTGNYSEKLQPETVWYCPRMFNVMQNWQVEETWNIHAAEFTKQKPLEITKNKPKDVKKEKRDYKNEGKSTSSSSTNSRIRGLSF